MCSIRSSSVVVGMSPEPATRRRSHVLVSLRPRFAELVLNGSKTTELRRGGTSINAGSLALIYASTPVRSLVGAVRIEEVHTRAPSTVWRRWGKSTGLQRREYNEYVDGCLQVSALTLGARCTFPEPISLHELRARTQRFVVPQSYRFVREAELGAMLNGERVLLSELELHRST